MFLTSLNDRERRKSLLAWLSAFAVLSLVAIGIFAKNGWFLSEAPALAGGREAAAKSMSVSGAHADSLESALPQAATPQLSKEYVYAGSRLLAVEDANANAAPPADLAVWRPSSGTWYILGGTGSAQTSYTWGTSGDVPLQGDFDGDGKTDFSIFRPSTGVWYITKSSDGSYYTVSLGISTDLPAVADFDGDGKTDVAVYRPSNGTWYIVRSSDSTLIYPVYGGSTDKPTPADFDGDGKADLAVWRDSNHTFYSLNSSTATSQSASFGQTGDTPVSADYDGDGKANYALKSGNDWIILNAANSATTTTSWQLSTDIPVQNDYDGDGKTDIATWRPSNGNWYIRKSGSSNALRQEAWGTTGDIPVPAYFRR